MSNELRLMMMLQFRQDRHTERAIRQDCPYGILVSRTQILSIPSSCKSGFGQMVGCAALHPPYMPALPGFRRHVPARTGQARRDCPYDFSPAIFIAMVCQTLRREP